MPNAGAGAGGAPKVTAAGAGAEGVAPKKGAAGARPVAPELKLGPGGGTVGVPPNENPEDGAGALSVEAPNRNGPGAGAAEGVGCDGAPKEKPLGAEDAVSFDGCEPKDEGAAGAFAEELPNEKVGAPEGADVVGAPNDGIGIEGPSSARLRLRLLRSSSAESRLDVPPAAGAVVPNAFVEGKEGAAPNWKLLLALDGAPKLKLGRAEPSVSSALCAELDEVSVSPGCADFNAGGIAVGSGSEAKPNEVWGSESDCFAPTLKVKGFASTLKEKGFLSPPPGAGTGPAPNENVVVSSFFSRGAEDVAAPKENPLVLLSAFFSLGAPKENVAFFISSFFSAGATAGTPPKENPTFLVSSFFPVGAVEGAAPNENPLGVISFLSIGTVAGPAPNENPLVFATSFFSLDLVTGVVPNENPLVFGTSFFSEVVDPKLNEGAEGRTESDGVGVDVPPNLKAGVLVVFPESTNLGSLAAGGGGTTVAPNVNPLLPVEVPDGMVESVPNLKPPALPAGTDVTGVAPKLKPEPDEPPEAAGALPKLKPVEPIEPGAVVPAVATGAAPKEKPLVPIVPLLPLAL